MNLYYHQCTEYMGQKSEDEDFINVRTLQTLCSPSTSRIIILYGTLVHFTLIISEKVKGQYKHPVRLKRKKMPMISRLQKARRARLWLNINLRCYRTEKVTLTTRSKQVPLHPLMNIKCVNVYKSILVYLIWFHSQPLFYIRWLQEEIWFHLLPVFITRLFQEEIWFHLLPMFVTRRFQKWIRSV